MKQIYAELTDINGTKHVANLSEMTDPPNTIKSAQVLLTNYNWLKVQDDQMVNMDHIVIYKIKEL